jgi:hypothetical protein
LRELIANSSQVRELKAGGGGGGEFEILKKKKIQIPLTNKNFILFIKI